MYDLTGFQRDILQALAALHGSKPKGLRVKDELETDDKYNEVNHGRLYPNLDRLVEMGLVHKSSLDRRSNAYELTRRGRREAIDYSRDWVDAVSVLADADVPETDTGETTGLDSLFDGTGARND